MAGYRNPFERKNYSMLDPSFSFLEPGGGGGGLEEQAGPGGPGGPGASLPPDFFNFNQPNLDAFSEHLGGLPQRDDHRSGAINSILAAILGGTTGYTTGNPAQGAAAGMEQLDRPYNRAIEDWSMKASNLGSLAGLDLQTNENKANILKAIQDGDLERLKLMVEQQRNQGQIDRWQGQTGAEFGRLGLDEQKLNLEGQQFGLEQEDSAAMRALQGQRGGYYDAMAEKAGGLGEGGFDPDAALAMSDYILDPTVFRSQAPLDIQNFFELNPESGRMDLIPAPQARSFGRGVDPNASRGYERARQWYLEVTGQLGQR